MAIVSVAACVCVFSDATASAQLTCARRVDYTNQELLATGDLSTGIAMCDQDFIDWAWDGYGFKKDKWDDGKGHAAPCDVTKPLGRVLNTIHMLTYTNPISGPHDRSTDPLIRWAFRYARKEIDDFRARCIDVAPLTGGNGEPSGGTIALYQNRPGPDRVYWYMAAAYRLIEEPSGLGYWSVNNSPWVVDRAGFLIHEARHADKGHNGGSDCTARGSCDKGWNYDGAVTWEVSLLQNYWATGMNGTPAQYTRARTNARVVANLFFKTIPVNAVIGL